MTRLAGVRRVAIVRGVNIELLRSFVVISELGSLSKAAERMRVSQSTLTRQMQALEQEVGGRLFDRGHSGVALTAAGQRLLAGMRPILAQVDTLLEEIGGVARGRTSTIRVGYLASMAADHLGPALRLFRQAHPTVKVSLLDLTPGEQVEALRGGRIDVGFMGDTDPSIRRDFYVRSFGSLPVEIALPEDHRLAAAAQVRLKDLRGETFISVPDRDVPGYNRWLTQLCRKAGFRPRFGEAAESLGHAFTLVVSDHLVTTAPRYSMRAAPPGVVFKELPPDDATWDLLVCWQRGKLALPVRDLVEAMARTVQPRTARS